MLLGATTLSSMAQGYKDGIEYYKAGQYDNAITLLQRNLNNSDTDKALAYYYLGSSYLANNNKTEAKKYFELGTQANPQCGYNYVGLGALALMDKDKSAAEKYFDTAKKNAKKNTEVLVDIARAYFNADPVAYDKEITKLIDKARKDSKLKDPSIYVFEGDRKFKAKDYNGAATEYEQAITFDEDNPEGYVKYANTYFYVVPQYAIEKLKELLQRNPTSALAQRELAEKYYMNDQWTDAAKQYGEYIKNPNHFPEDKARYAVLLYAGGKHDESLQTAREVLGQTPDNTMLQRLVFFNLNNLNRKEEALTEAQQYFANAKNDSQFNAADYRTYANLLYEVKKDTIGTKDIILKGIQKYPKDAQLYRALADWYFDQKDYPSWADNINLSIENTSDPKSNEYFSAAGSNRFAALAKYATEEVDAAKEYAENGLKLMEKAMEGVISPYQYYRRVGQLAVLANNKVPDQKAAEAYEETIKLLDQDATNKTSNADVYREAYGILYTYYNALGDTEKADAAKAQYDTYKNN